MMVTRSAPVCGLTNPSGPERFRFETHHGDYRTEHAAISSRGTARRRNCVRAESAGAAKPASRSQTVLAAETQSPADRSMLSDVPG
jgi:hypothetical protein